MNVLKKLLNIDIKTMKTQTNKTMKTQTEHTKGKWKVGSTEPTEVRAHYDDAYPVVANCNMDAYILGFNIKMEEVNERLDKEPELIVEYNSLKNERDSFVIQAKANAQRICHCVNNFDELVEALEWAYLLVNGEWMNRTLNGKKPKSMYEIKELIDTTIKKVKS